MICRIQQSDQCKWWSTATGTFGGYNGKGLAVVKFNGKTLTLPPSRVWLQKHKKKKLSTSTEVITKRVHRFRRALTVVPTVYRGPGYGNFMHMIRMPRYNNDGVFLFNDNHNQWVQADPNKPTFHELHTHYAGGGNAGVRPQQMWGDAIGIPTGPYDSLDEVCHVDNDAYTVKQIIHLACFRIVDLFISRPDKEILYYSCNDGSDQLGLGIFAGSVGHDVIEYATKCIKTLPKMLEYTRKQGVHPTEDTITQMMHPDVIV